MEVGLTLVARINLKSAEEGGRRWSIEGRFRPLCHFTAADGGTAVIGLCEVTLPNPLSPGGATTGRFLFDRSVSVQVRELARVGSTFGVAEGPHVIGIAEVVAID